MSTDLKVLTAAALSRTCALAGPTLAPSSRLEPDGSLPVEGTGGKPPLYANELGGCIAWCDDDPETEGGVRT